MNIELFCLPVYKTGSVYKETNPESVTASSWLVPYEDIIDYLDRHYTKEYGTVFIRGVSYQTQIYLPTDTPDDFSYIVVDSNCSPVDSPRPLPEGRSRELIDAINNQLTKVFELCHKTESLFPTTQLNIEYSYIRPRLQKITIENSFIVHLPDNERECSFEEVIAEPRVVIIGQPGSGKTTFLRYFALNLIDLESKSDNAAIPVYVQLRNYKPSEGLNGFLPDQFSNKSINISTVRFAWILDGFDEVSTQCKDDAKSAILELIEKRRDDSFILCSRASSYDFFLRNECMHFQLLPFNSNEISQWIYQKLRGERSTPWRALLHSLSNVPEVKSIARNPLLLSVLTHYYCFSGVVPQQRAELLERFVDTLCEDWDSVRGINRYDSRSFAPYRRSNILSWIAFEMKLSNIHAVTENNLYGWREKFAPAFQSPEKKSILVELSEDTGIMVWSSKENAYVFIHQLFCDYLAARHLVSMTEDVGPMLDKLAENDSWQDVWILACAITHDATHLISGVLDSKKINDDMQAILLAGAISQGVDLNEKLKISCRRVIKKAFLKHANEIENTIRLNEDMNGSSKTLTIVADENSSKWVTQKEDYKYLRKLLTFIYRARWWQTGETIVFDLKETGGSVGESVATLLSQKGTIKGLDEKLTTSSGGQDLDVLLEVANKLDEE